MSLGKVVQVIGAVIDVEFLQGAVPKIYDALKVKALDLTLEVQQQLGDGWEVVVKLDGGTTLDLPPSCLEACRSEAELVSGQYRYQSNPEHSSLQRYVPSGTLVSDER